jgi:hypothetical protein
MYGKSWGGFNGLQVLPYLVLILLNKIAFLSVATFESFLAPGWLKSQRRKAKSEER